MGVLTHYSHAFREDSQAAGLPSGPVSLDGALRFFERRRARFFCSGCQTMQAVRRVLDIKHALKQSFYDAVLDCAHRRTVTLNTRKTQD